MIVLLCYCVVQGLCGEGCSLHVISVVCCTGLLIMGVVPLHVLLLSSLYRVGASVFIGEVYAVALMCWCVCMHGLLRMAINTPYAFRGNL